MNIGCDIDDVLVQFMEGFIRFYNQRNSTDFILKDFVTYDVWKIFGGTRQEAIKSVEDSYNSDLFDLILPVKGSLAVLKQLREKNELFAITARPTKFKPKTEKFLEDHFKGIFSEVIYSGLFYEGINKSTICQNLGVKVIVEDNLKYAKDCAENNISVYLFDRPWNQGNNFPKNLKRIYHWADLINKSGLLTA